MQKSKLSLKLMYFQSFCLYFNMIFVLFQMRTGPYTCRIDGCGKRVNGSERLHMRMQHDPKTTALQCITCNHADTIPDGMQGHILDVHGESVSKGYVLTLEVECGIVYEKLLVCQSCPNFRHWNRQGIEKHGREVHPDIAVQSRRIRLQAERSVAETTARLLALRISPRADPEVHDEEEWSRLEDSKRAVLATAPHQSPALQLSDAQLNRAYEEASAAAANAKPVFIVPRAALPPRKMVVVKKETREMSTQAVANVGLFIGLTHRCALNCELFTEISGQTVWCASIYFDRDMPIHRQLYFGLSPDEPMAKFYLNPHPGGRLLGYGSTEPTLNQYTEYRGVVIRSEGVFEHAYIYTSRVEPTTGIWRVWSGKTPMGTATVQKDRMQLFKFA